MNVRQLTQKLAVLDGEAEVLLDLDGKYMEITEGVAILGHELRHGQYQERHFVILSGQRSPNLFVDDGKKWQPKKGDTVYFATDEEVVQGVYNDSDFHRELLKARLMFSTEQFARIRCEQLKK